jgi:predicted dehydrogenase
MVAMRQIVQNLRSGAVTVLDVPEPQPREGYVLVAVERSVISSGTELSIVDVGAKSLLGKARARPDAVRKTIEVARTEGIRSAAGKVRARIERPFELGYSVAGRVLDTGGDPRLSTGMLVSAVGAGYAVHADVVLVPRNLVIPVPDAVSPEQAAFAAPAAVALHGFRLAEPQPGGTILVIGLGLIGQLAVRVAVAAGALVVATDPRPERRDLARTTGATSVAGPDLEQAVKLLSRGRGADAVLICAATQSDEPLRTASVLARDRASIVVIGDVPLRLDRRSFYAKELSLLVARSYGPGRYDREYEEGGRDLPAGYVRWTEGRNVEAVLDLLGTGRVNFDDLVTVRVPADDAASAYDRLREDRSVLAVVIEYEEAKEYRPPAIGRSRGGAKSGALRIAFIGAGAFARSVLAPIIVQGKAVEIVGVAARSGASAESFASKFGATTATTDWVGLVTSADVDAVVIATPHREHAEMAATCLRAGMHTFVEKPLALTREELALVFEAARDSTGVLLVGHNRRFAPLAQRLRDLGRPLLVSIRVAAGNLGGSHWLQDADQGGRILGELSHFVDLASFVVGASPRRVLSSSVPGDDAGSLAALFEFDDGSVATITYSTRPSDGLPKERIEVLGTTSSAVLDDFRRLDVFGARRSSVKRRQDKGHEAELAAFVAAARGEQELPVQLREQALVAAAAIAAVEAAATGLSVEIELP